MNTYYADEQQKENNRNRKKEIMSKIYADAQ